MFVKYLSGMLMNLEPKVNEYLALGWKLHGPLVGGIDTQPGRTFIQALSFYSEFSEAPRYPDKRDPG